MKKKKAKRKVKTKPIIAILIIIALLVMSVLVIKKLNTKKPIDLYANIFSSTYKTGNININKYTVYGTHFNIEGISDTINTVDEIRDVKLVLKSLNGESEIKHKIEYKLKGKNLTFSISKFLNQGINLEELPVGIYILFIDVEHYNEIHRYYTLHNTTEYGEIEYYTITKNVKNNKINIGFDKYTDSLNNEFNYMYIKVEETSLPEDVYDIVVDAGHGGTDSGAVKGEYKEADIVLEYAISLKQELEKLGLKVFMTREGSEDKKEKTAYTMYDENGRVNIVNASKAKYNLSLHLNSNEDTISRGGVEVYSPCKSDLIFAKNLADNIVNIANTTYSNNDYYKKDEGVYVENFTNASIESFKKRAVKEGYEPYNLTTDTPYLYMIREVGGICTNAFVDGRNTDYGANRYVNSNIGIESYLLELGYISFENDLNNIVQNKDLYIQAIVKSVEKEIYKMN